MPSETLEKLNKELVCKHLCHVTDKDAAWVLLQEPGFIGFGVVQRNDILWSPNKPQDSPNWNLVTDLRLFGEKGEWHVWRDWDREHRCRLLQFTEEEWHVWFGWDRENQDSSQKSGKKVDTLTEYHFLWGTKKEESGHPHWIKLVEDRGTEIWLPLAEYNLKESDLPLRLKIKQIVGYDPDSHLAGITDAALIGLVGSSSKKLLLPTDLFSCS